MFWKKRKGENPGSSKLEIENLADTEARELLGVAGRSEAFAMLARGELAGTRVEPEFRSLKNLLAAR